MAQSETLAKPNSTPIEASANKNKKPTGQSPSDENQRPGNDRGRLSTREIPLTDQPPVTFFQRIHQAAQNMRHAHDQLQQEQRPVSVEEQNKAVEQLELAKAELKKILRQLREEEMGWMLSVLDTRFRQMLELQLKVYEGTLRLDRIPVSQREHDEEIEAGRLSRLERKIVLQADRAIILLSDEGTSVAFPVAVNQIRGDMQQVVTRLVDVQLGKITQGIEEDIIAALKEMIAALNKAMKDMEQLPGSMSAAGQPSEPALVEKLAELKLIRSLQQRVNRRTERYGELLAAGGLAPPDFQSLLDLLVKRQQSIQQATEDLAWGRDQ